MGNSPKNFDTQFVEVAPICQKTGKIEQNRWNRREKAVNLQVKPTNFDTKMQNTSKQYDEAIAQCRELFINKMKDYGPSWRILRPQSVTDQIFIKAKRIRTLELNGETKVGEGIWPEFIGIINYGIIGLIQLRLGYSDTVDITAEQALTYYDELIGTTKDLMIAKNTDYGEAWRDMRISSYTDLILTKIQRTKEIENHNGKTLVSEGIDANYQDMINYSVFALIKHNEELSQTNA